MSCHHSMIRCCQIAYSITICLICELIYRLSPIDISNNKSGSVNFGTYNSWLQIYGMFSLYLRSPKEGKIYYKKLSYHNNCTSIHISSTDSIQFSKSSFLKVYK